MKNTTKASKANTNKKKNKKSKKDRLVKQVINKIQKPSGSKNVNIELFDTLTVSDSHHYQFGTSASDTLQIQNLLGLSDEFNSLRQLWVRYKIKTVSTTFNLDRFVELGSVLPKVYIRTQTDNGDFDMLLNPGMCSVWDLKKYGTKHTYMNINTTNTDTDYVDWLPGTSSYNGYIRLKVKEGGVIDTTSSMVLGTLRIRITFITIQKDVNTLVDQMKQVTLLQKENEDLRKQNELLINNLAKWENTLQGIRLNEK